MAKKASKKEAPAAKKKTLAKPVKAAPTKVASKAATPAKKAVAKPAKSKEPAKGTTVKLVEKKPIEKGASKGGEKKFVAPPASIKTVLSEKKSKEASVEVKKTKEAKPEKAAKKEKKVKVDKSGFSEDQAKWHELFEKYKAVKASSYSIGGQFEAKSPLQHKIFGWGFILSNEYDRLEVLFEDGKRMLISNRKLS